jgi:hypothetical protein
MNECVIEVAKTISELAEENSRLKSAAVCHDESVDRLKDYAENLEQFILTIWERDKSLFDDEDIVFVNKIRMGEARPYVYGWARTGKSHFSTKK